MAAGGGAATGFSPDGAPTFVAFGRNPIGPPIDELVTSLASYDTYDRDSIRGTGRLFVGTASGMVRVFDINDAGGKSGVVHEEVTACSTTLTRKRRRPVVSLAVLTKHSLLLALCDGIVTLHRTDTLTEVARAHDARGAVVKGVDRIAVDQTDPEGARVCLVAKRRIEIFAVRGESLEHQNSLSIAGEPRTVAYRNRSLLVGYTSPAPEYNVINDHNGAVETLPMSLTSSCTPLVEPVSDGQLLMISSDNIGMYVFPTGEDAPHSTVHWESGMTPTSVAYAYPYLICFSTKMPTVLVMRHSDSQLVQVMELPGPPTATCDGNAGQLDHQDGRNPMYVACGSDGMVFRLQPEDFELQYSQLLSIGDDASAAELLEAVKRSETSDAGRRRAERKFHRIAARVLVMRLEFDRAAAHLRAAELPPQEIIALFPEMQPKSFDYRCSCFSAVLTRAIAAGERTPADAADLFDDGIDPMTSTLPASMRDIIESVRRHADAYKESKAIRDDEEAMASSAPSGGRRRLFGRGTTAKATVQSLRLDDSWGHGSNLGSVGRLSRAALRMAIEYIEYMRERPNPEWDRPGTSTLLDTAKARGLAVLDASPGSALEVYLKSHPELDFADVKDFLLSHELYHACAVLSEQNRFVEEALTMWQRLGRGELRDKSRRKSRRKAQAAGATAATSAAAGGGGGGEGEGGDEESQAEVDGVEDTVRVLSESEDEAAVLAFTEWVLKRYPARGMEILCSTRRRTPLRHATVLAYLQRSEFASLVAVHGPTETKRKLRHLYLRFLVTDLNVADERYHTELAKDYLELVQSQRQGEGLAEPRGGGARAGHGAFEALRRVARWGMEDAEPEEADQPTRVKPGEEQGSLGLLRAEMLRLLETSRYYDKTQILSDLLRTDLFEEQVVVYSRLNDHHKALAVLLRDLGDLEGAEQYCLAHFLPEHHQQPQRNPFMALAEILLSGGDHAAITRPGDDNRGGIGEDLRGPLPRDLLDATEAAAERTASGGDPSASESATTLAMLLQRQGMLMLRRYPQYMHGPSVLSMLPGSASMASVGPLISQILPAAASRARRARLTQSLVDFERLRVNEALVVTQRRHIILRRDVRCSESKQRIGESVFVLQPDGRPVLYHVLGDRALATDERTANLDGLPDGVALALDAFWGPGVIPKGSGPIFETGERLDGGAEADEDEGDEEDEEDGGRVQWGGAGGW